MKHQRIAITGGIGSGKSFVCALLKDFGIEVYDCDAAAKRLMRTSQPIKQALCRLIGEEAYQDGILQKGVVARFLLSSDANKQALNEIVHPAVASDFEQSDYEWLESAILFESGFYRRIDFDSIVCVTAPDQVRVERIVQRDSISHSQARQWLSLQMPQEEMANRSDHIICNDGFQPVVPQLEKLLRKLHLPTDKRPQP